MIIVTHKICYTAAAKLDLEKDNRDSKHLKRESTLVLKSTFKKFLDLFHIYPRNFDRARKRLGIYIPTIKE